ncbi:uncharacterized protein GLRG_07725 [Colletotrichum graminicola M1.001]|uniref:Uncharacterized protein n=1 Tax=Colletotrichum graminicola (strain M1.001 / M2 / FGSC 10212) TaxID=645133 RepID=E3QNG8_COLGM|nr:uncharacterized protein GLRG_07725 [Colletotrichum graminicola M1.001]EFQ32455.1 hypothetical protein GLRG_07725 [Colletotrichum graminicola M1.001]
MGLDRNVRDLTFQMAGTVASPRHDMKMKVRLLGKKEAKKQSCSYQLASVYEDEFWQIRQFLKESAAPRLFVFAALSLILSAMQVVLAAKQDDDGGWRASAELSAWFAVTVIVVVAVVFVGLALVGSGFWLWQFQFGYRSWRRSRAVFGEARIRNGRGG